MPQINTITPPPAAVAEPTEAERLAKQLVGDSDLALQRLITAVQAGFELLWGTKGNPKPKDEAQAIIDALGADVTSVFARHAALVQLLAADGLATFEPWEITPAYAITVVDGQIQLGDLVDAWTN